MWLVLTDRIEMAEIINSIDNTYEHEIYRYSDIVMINNEIWTNIYLNNI